MASRSFNLSLLEQEEGEEAEEGEGAGGRAGGRAGGGSSAAEQEALVCELA